MNSPVERWGFASDNVAPICPEGWAALQQANAQYAASYGDDYWTARVCDRVREIFETDCDVYFVFNGTAANGLALAQLSSSFESILCYKRAHVYTDECGAPEFFTGGSQLLLVGGQNGKIGCDAVQELLARKTDLHSHKPGAISIAQATEFGTVYTQAEIATIAEVARSHNLLLHMDGARFANAIASLKCPPKAITSDVGVDVLCFGGTKNGTAAGELVIFFNRNVSRDFDYRVKQAGQLASKMRFLAAPWLALLTDGVWLRNAEHANKAARRLANRLREEAGIESVFPVEANSVFVSLDDQQVNALNEQGWTFFKFADPDVYRLMCSWATTDEEISRFIANVITIND